MNKWALQFFHCLTPLHNGAGQGLTSLDRPIIREAGTNYPFIQSSTIKGTYRDKAMGKLEQPWNGNGETINEGMISAAFGKGETGGHQGCLVFTDAALAAFPVRSLFGTFVLATSTLPLARLHRWLQVAERPATDPLLKALEEVLSKAAEIDRQQGKALGCSHWSETPSTPPASNPGRWDGAIRLNGNGDYCIEGLVLKPFADRSGEAGRALAELAFRLSKAVFGEDPGNEYWRTLFRERLLLLSGTDFKDFTERATQVEANIAIDDKSGVTIDGTLRYSEYLPAETVLVSLVTVEKPYLTAVDEEKVWGLYKALGNEYIQFGADESKGRGIVSARIMDLTGG